MELEEYVVNYCLETLSKLHLFITSISIFTSLEASTKLEMHIVECKRKSRSIKY